MRTFIENYLHFMKNCIRPHYEKLKPLKSGFIDNSNFENNRDPCVGVMQKWHAGCQNNKCTTENSMRSIPNHTLDVAKQLL